jgi:glycerophosphoryl diester phosphodiesterase
VSAIEHWRRSPQDRPLILGHRGVRGPRPENTMLAFEHAFTDGADGIELDVRLCRGDAVVVLHDRTLTRVTGGSVLRDVERLTPAELRRVDVGSGQAPPLLGDVLDWAKSKDLRVNVELKHDVSSRLSLAEGVLRLVRSFADAPAWVLISSFDPWLVRYVSWRAPTLLTAWLVHAKQRMLRTAPRFQWLGARAVHPERVLATADRIDDWKRAGAVVNVWTVNDPLEARQLADSGVDALISDVPGQIKSVFV